MSSNVSPLGTTVSEQVMKRLAGCRPVKVPCGITATVCPVATRDGGAGDDARNGEPAPASVASMPGEAAAKLAIILRMGPPKKM
jgi:hypothetical protein